MGKNRMSRSERLVSETSSGASVSTPMTLRGRLMASEKDGFASADFVFGSPREVVADWATPVEQVAVKTVARVERALKARKILMALTLERSH